MNEYEGHWITTYTGRRLHYLKPQLDEIDIIDIAHALALTCRFGGQINTFYSVAEHSIRVAGLVVPQLKLAALLHDAHEAYLHDVPRPIKNDIPGYREIADGLQNAIDAKYGIGSCKEIRRADNIMLITEARDLGMNTTDWAELGVEPLEEVIMPWDWKDAESSFMVYFNLWRV